MAQTDLDRRNKSDQLEGGRGLVRKRAWVNEKHEDLFLELAVRMEGEKIRNIKLLEDFIAREKPSGRKLKLKNK